MQKQRAYTLLRKCLFAAFFQTASMKNPLKLYTFQQFFHLNKKILILIDGLIPSHFFLFFQGLLHSQPSRTISIYKR